MSSQQWRYRGHQSLGTGSGKSQQLAGLDKSKRPFVMKAKDMVILQIKEPVA